MKHVWKPELRVGTAPRARVRVDEPGKPHRTGGACVSHYRTAGIANRARLHGGVAACGARATNGNTRDWIFALRLTGAESRTPYRKGVNEVFFRGSEPCDGRANAS